MAETNRFGESAFDALASAHCRVVSIWCQAPKYFRPWPGPLHLLQSRKYLEAKSFPPKLVKRGVKIQQIKRPYLENLELALRQCGDVDFLLVAGSSIIFPKDFLDKLSIPIFNIHPALLPAYRGPMPVHALVLNNDADKFGGITLHKLEAGIDTGPIIKQTKIALSDYSSVVDWQSDIYRQCADLVKHGILPYLRSEISAVEQDESQASYLSKEQVPTYISSTMSFAEVEDFSRKSLILFANTKLLFWGRGNKSEMLRVIGPPKRLGPLTGKPARVSFWTIDLDLSDCRAEFQINNRLRRMRAKPIRFFKRR